MTWERASTRTYSYYHASILPSSSPPAAPTSLPDHQVFEGPHSHYCASTPPTALIPFPSPPPPPPSRPFPDQIIMRGLHASGEVNRTIAQGLAWWKREQDMAERRHKELEAVGMRRSPPTDDAAGTALGDRINGRDAIAIGGGNHMEGAAGEAAHARDPSDKSGASLQSGSGAESSSAGKWSGWSKRAGKDRHVEMMRSSGQHEAQFRANQQQRAGSAGHMKSSVQAEEMGRGIIRPWHNNGQGVQGGQRRLMEIQLTEDSAVPPLPSPGFTVDWKNSDHYLSSTLRYNGSLQH